VAAARCELAASFLGDLRRIDAQLLDASKKLTVAPFTSNYLATMYDRRGSLSASFPHQARARVRDYAAPDPGGTASHGRIGSGFSAMRQREAARCLTAVTISPAACQACLGRCHA
jgi:hypothetical protein